MKVNRIGKYEVTGAAINIQSATIFEPVILTGFCTSISLKFAFGSSIKAVRITSQCFD